MKEKTVCFTGHRNIPVAQLPALRTVLKTTLTTLIQSGYTDFCAGGALGFDTIAAETVLELRQEFPHIRLILVLPCPQQTNKWSAQDKQIYETIKEVADEVMYTSNAYTRGCMHVRNRKLVELSSVCISYLTQNRGGTYYTVGYAKSHGVPVLNMAERL